MRDHDKEFADNERRYAYDFDWVLRRYMMRAFKPFLVPGKALEMGCFDGQSTELLLEDVGPLTVLEASKELLERARIRIGDKAWFVHARFEEAEPGIFENIFLIHTLEHLDEPVGTLRRAATWLAPGGRFFIAVPNANAPSRQIAVKMGLISHNSAVTDAEFKHGHRITYSLDTLERDIRAAGLPIVHRGGVFFKALANYQFDRLLKTDIITPAYLDGCYELGTHYPDLCASVYCICGKP